MPKKKGDGKCHSNVGHHPWVAAVRRILRSSAMLMSPVLLLGLFLGGETAYQDVRGTCADIVPAAACALHCPWDNSRDQLERQALEGSLEEDEEEEALPDRPSGAVTVLGL